MILNNHGGTLVSPGMNRSRLLLWIPLVALVSTSLAEHRDDERQRGGPRIILYENAGYRGNSITLFGSEALENLDRMSFDGGRRANDRISSIRVEGGAVLLAYEHSDFRGQVIRVTESIPNLADRARPEGAGTWNDRLSSLQAEAGGRAHGDHRHGDRRAPPDGADYERIIARAYDDVLRRAPDADGLRHYRGLLIDQGWTEQMVRAQLRRSDEYRGPVINGLIARAYRDLLGRQPDPSGLDHYRNLLIDHGLTEQGMRDDLRRSAEYRQRHQPPAPHQLPAPVVPPRNGLPRAERPEREADERLPR